MLPLLLLGKGKNVQGEEPASLYPHLFAWCQLRKTLALPAASVGQNTREAPTVLPHATVFGFSCQTQKVEGRGRSQGPRLSFLKDSAVDPWANAQEGNAS